MQQPQRSDKVEPRAQEVCAALRCEPVDAVMKIALNELTGARIAHAS